MLLIQNTHYLESSKEKKDYKLNSSITKLAVITTHPIQYHVPFYQILSEQKEIDLKVFFCSDWGLKPYTDKEFGQAVKWDIPLTDGYKSDFLPNMSPIPNPYSFFGVINPGIIKKIQSENFDAVWIHGWGYFTTWLALLTAFPLRVPVLLRGESNLLSPLNPLKAIVKRNMLSFLFKKVSAFLAIGRYNAEFYEEYGVPKEKIFHVPYAVNNDYFFSKAKELIPKKSFLKEKHGIPIDLPVILFSGKLISVKQPMELLQAYNEVLKEKTAALIFVGDGLLRKKLETYTKEQNLKNVYFMGFKNQTELPEFYAMADIFVLPSCFEPWGIVVNEAMCFGLPLIVSDQVGASRDLVKDKVNGYIYPSSNFKSLAKRLILLLSDNALRYNMGQASRELIRNWSYKEGVKGVMQCLESIKKHDSKQIKENVAK